MITYCVAFLSALMMATFCTIAVRNRAIKYGWLDQARTSRKIHANPIPRLGGIAIVIGFLAPLSALLVVDSGVGQTFRGHPELITAVFAGGIAIALLGLWDDFRGADALLKFTIQFAVAGAVFASGLRIESIANPFGAPISLGYLALPFTVLWIVGVINAMNLIDGLDGLAGGVAFFVVATNFVLAIARGEVLLCLFMAALGGALIGFLVFNSHPASIFMGDTGSMFLGFVLATISIKTSAKSGTAVAMLVPILALGLPIMDTLLAVVRRTLLGRRIFSSDKEHIHHRLMSRLSLTHRDAVLLLYGLNCLFAMTALAMAYANSAQGAMLLVGVAIVVFALMRKLGYLSFHRVSEVSGMRRRNVQLRALVKEVNGEIAAARSIESIWTSVRPLAELLQAASLELRVDEISFETRRPMGSALPFDLRLDIQADHRPIGKLKLSWQDGRSEVDRDEELAVEIVADSIGKAAGQLLSRSAPHKLRLVASGK
jgi:UDP-GlcNAc:undecaprenyl-phosphate GlcNAc-1-phosphate transferase